jgi:small subunit ribosomal protein S20
LLLWGLCGMIPLGSGAGTPREPDKRRYPLANTKSAIKRIGQNENRRLRNRTVRTKVRGLMKAARGAQGTEQRTAVLDAIRALDKAVTKGVIHRNTAARKKSALARRLVAAK